MKIVSALIQGLVCTFACYVVATMVAFMSEKSMRIPGILNAHADKGEDTLQTSIEYEVYGGLALTLVFAGLFYWLQRRSARRKSTTDLEVPTR